ncbi:MAG: DUF3341 domain-containing protein [Bdellovibrionales bacterium]
MENTNTAAFGIYSNTEELKKALHALRRMGFGSSEISVLFPKNAKKNQDMAYREINLIKEGLLIGGALGIILVGGLTFMVTGVFAYALVGAAFGGIYGGVSGTLVGIGTPERVSRRYGHYVKGGGILVSVHTEGSQQTVLAKNVLERTGAQEINTLNESAVWETVMEEREKPNEFLRWA